MTWLSGAPADAPAGAAASSALRETDGPAAAAAEPPAQAAALAEIRCAAGIATGSGIDAARRVEHLASWTTLLRRRRWRRAQGPVVPPVQQRNERSIRDIVQGRLASLVAQPWCARWLATGRGPGIDWDPIWRVDFDKGYNGALCPCVQPVVEAGYGIDCGADTSLRDDEVSVVDEEDSSPTTLYPTAVLAPTLRGGDSKLRERKRQTA